MVAFSSLITYASLLLTTTDARRHLDLDPDAFDAPRVPVQNAEQSQANALGTVNSPLVKGTDCTELCLFKDDHNEWCAKFQSPVVTLGWDFEQGTDDTDNYWYVRLSPYLENQFNFESEFKIDRIYQNEFFLKLPAFTVGVGTTFLFQETGKVCLGVSYD